MKLLEAQGIGFLRGARPVLRDIDMGVDSGELVGLIGPNGAGKSTLLRILAGLLGPAAGRISCAGHALGTLSSTTRARLIGYHAQIAELHWPLRVADIIALGRLPYGAGPALLSDVDRAAIARAAARTDLDGLLERRGDTLSGGELARVHVARLLAGEHRVLLADEPIANLDPHHQLAVLGLLREHADHGNAAVVVLHDLASAARFCDRLVLLDEGRVHVAGTPGTVLDRANVCAVFRVPADYHHLSGIAATLAARR